MKLRHFDGFAVLAVVILFLCSMSHAQSVGGIGSSIQAPYTNTVQMQDHPAHADQGSLRTEVSLLGSNGVTTAHGERPLTDFPSDRIEVSLGDVARAYRQEHAKAEKASRIWNQ